MMFHKWHLSTGDRIWSALGFASAPNVGLCLGNIVYEKGYCSCFCAKLSVN